MHRKIVLFCGRKVSNQSAGIEKAKLIEFTSAINKKYVI